MIVAELTLYFTKNGGYKNITELNGTYLFRQRFIRTISIDTKNP